jgi:hypothetical protein
MAHAITFNTLAYAKKLESSGIPQKQAEAQAEALADIFEKSLDTVATKQDILELKTEITGKFTLLYWMIGFLLTFSVGITFGVFGVLFKLSTH